MNSRIQTFWLSGLTIILLTFCNLLVPMWAGRFPHGFSLISEASLLIYFPYLLGFVVIGALGAYRSWRTNSKPSDSLQLCALPIILLIGTFFLFSPVSFALLASSQNVGYFLGCFLRWVIFPAVALVIGALPFLLRSNRNGPAHNLNLG